MRLGVTLAFAIVFAASTAAQQRTFTEYSMPPAVTGFPIAPFGLTAGPDGNMWFTDYTSSRIGKISLKGDATTFSVPSYASYPSAIASGPDGNIWFVETTLTSKIGRITPSGIFAEFSTPTVGAGLSGIVAGPDGNLWFTEGAGYANHIGRITPAGVITEFLIPTPLSNSAGIALGPDGNLWFTESTPSKIGRITTSGSITEFPLPNSGSRPGLITAGTDGNLWFTESGNLVGRITPAGAVKEFPVNGSISSMVGWQTGVWFTDTANNAIGVIDATGTVTEFPIPTGHSNPSGIAVGPDGNLWFTEPYSSKVGVLSGVSTGVSAPSITAVVNAASGAPGAAPNTWLTIFGSNLAPAGHTRSWQGSDFVDGLMPTVLDGVGVTVGGVSAYVSYISTNQLNVLTPIPLVPAASGYVQVTNNGVASGAFLATIAEYSPSFFVFNGGPYVAALHADYTPVGSSSLFPGSSTPAKPGEVILVYGNGFGVVPGPYTPGSPVQSGSPPVPPVVTIGATRATVQFVGLTSAGLFQFNVVVPPSTPNGDNAISAQISSVGPASQTGTLINVQQ